MNPVLADLSEQMQKQATSYLPKAYLVGKLKAQRRVGILSKWSDRDRANIILLLNRHAEELSKAMVTAETRIAAGETLASILETFAGRVGAWSWALYPAMSLGMTSYVDDNRTEIAEMLPPPPAEQGQVARVPENDIGIIWHIVDETACKICHYLNGRWFDAHEAYDLAAAVHPNCLLPDNEVIPLGLEGMSRAWYDGIVYEIHTREGHSLTVTPNHPILTGDGFIAAEQLHEGSNIISTLDSQRMLHLVDPYDNQMPTPIEQVWNSLNISSEVSRRSMPVSPVDFHGDAAGFNGDIDIIYTNSFLLHYGEPFSPEHIYQDCFKGTDFGEVILASDSMQLLFGDRYLPPSDGDMGGICTGRPFKWCHSGEAQFIGFAPISWDNTSFKQLISNFSSGNSELSGCSQFRNTRLICVDNVGEYPHFIRNDNTSTPSFSKKPTFSYTELATKFLHRFSGLVTSDNIISKREYFYSGHVYDLQSTEQAYICDGAIVKNCRCPRAFDVGTPDEALVGPIPDYKPGTAQDIYANLNIAGLAQARAQAGREETNRIRRQNTPRGVLPGEVWDKQRINRERRRNVSRGKLSGEKYADIRI